jgi:WD40 repeat protein
VPLQVWDADAARPLTLEERVVPETHGAFAFAPDGRTLVIAGNRWLWYYDTATGRMRFPRLPTGNRRHRLLAARLHPDGRLLASYGPRASIAFTWYDPLGKPLPDGGFSGNSVAAVTAMEFTADGRALVTLGRGGLHLWEVATRRCLVHRPGNLQPFLFLGRPINPDRRRLVHRPGNLQSDRLSITPDGRLAAFLDGTAVRVESFTNLDSGTTLRPGSRQRFLSAAFTPDGRWLVTAGPGEAVTFWDVTNWQPAHEYAWDVGRLKCVAVAPDGLRAAAGTDKGQIVVWDVDL